MFKAVMTMAAALATSLLLATLSTAAAIGENIEPHTIQLRGSSDSIRLLAAKAPNSLKPNRFDEDRRDRIGSQEPARVQDVCSLLNCPSNTYCDVAAEACVDKPSFCSLVRCASGTYCNEAAGGCLEYGKCVDPADCSNPANGPFFQIKCYGTNTCENKKCGIDCGVNIRDPTKNEKYPKDTTDTTPEDDRQEKPIRLPVSPGIAKGVDALDLPCLVSTICEQPQLSILCGFITSNLGKWKSTTGLDNFFVGEGEGTFFAPLNGAFDDSSGSLLSNILFSDLQNPSILENVLSYHAAPIDATPNATDLFFSLEDFDCNDDLVMANGETTNTLCFDDGTKYQYGYGNRPLRTLPKIIQADIEACDSTVVLQFVDQLILPSLPLSGMPAQKPEVITPSDEIEIAVCPNDRPTLNAACQDPGGPCGYGYAYDGCSWNELQCSPNTMCTCSNVGETGTGSWSCSVNFLSACESPVAIASAFEEEASLETVAKALPKGECDPNKPLPSPSVLEECPVEPTRSCSGYEVGKSCEYGHMYMGCTWETLQCSFIEHCTCETDQSWSCYSRSVARCGTFDADLGWVEDKPEGLPWGEICSPDNDLPTPPPPSEEVESRLSVACPDSVKFNSCDGFESGLSCDYGYTYTGCTWETLGCNRSMNCECNKFGDGNWACWSNAMMYCPDKPEGHPQGKRCFPNEPLPSPSTVNASTSSSTTEAKNEEVVVSLMSGGIP